MTTTNSSQEQPLYIKVHPTDNVAIIVNNNGLPEGTQLALFPLRVGE